jgi:hypothetical protein
MAAAGLGDHTGAVRKENRKRHDQRTDCERDQQRPQARKQVIAQAEKGVAAEKISQDSLP